MFARTVAVDEAHYRDHMRCARWLGSWSRKNLGPRDDDTLTKINSEGVLARI